MGQMLMRRLYWGACINGTMVLQEEVTGWYPAFFFAALVAWEMRAKGAFER